MSGLVQKLSVASDTKEQLVHAISIFLAWHSSVSHFLVGVDVIQRPFLTLQWHENGKGQPLIAPLNSADAIADQIYAWLKTVDYDREPDHDGSNNRGWLIELNSAQRGDNANRGFYDVFTVYPYWVEYSK